MTDKRELYTSTSAATVDITIHHITQQPQTEPEGSAGETRQEKVTNLPTHTRHELLNGTLVRIPSVGQSWKHGTSCAKVQQLLSLKGSHLLHNGPEPPGNANITKI